MNGKNLFLAGLIGGVVIAILSNIPIISIANCLLCMWVWLGGAFAAWLYKRFQGSLTPGQGAGVGALAGVIAGLVGGVIGLLGYAGTQAALEAMGQYLDPELIGGIDLGSIVGPLSILGLCINLVAYTVFGALGGLIGGAIFKSKPAAVPAYVPPPAPVEVPPAYVPPAAPVAEPVAYPAVEAIAETLEEEPAAPPVESLPDIPVDEPLSPPEEPDQPAS